MFVGPFRGPDGANTTETDCAARTGRVWGQIKNQFERTALIRKCSTGCSSSPDSTDSSRSVIRAKSSKPNGRHPPSSRPKYFRYTYIYTCVQVLRGRSIRVADSIKNLFGREFETQNSKLLRPVSTWEFFFFFFYSRFAYLDVQLRVHIHCSISRREIFITERECIKSVV